MGEKDICRGNEVMVTGKYPFPADRSHYPTHENIQDSDIICDESRKGVEYSRAERILISNGSVALTEAATLTGNLTYPRRAYAPIADAGGHTLRESIACSIDIPAGMTLRSIKAKGIINKPEWSTHLQLAIMVQGRELEEIYYLPTGFRQEWYELCVPIEENKTVTLCAILNTTDEEDRNAISDRVVFYGWLEGKAVDNY